MEHYETEDQQLDAIKKWWNENGTSLLIGIAIGVAVLSGWDFYHDQKNMHSTEASDMYISLVTQINSNAYDESSREKSRLLVTDYSDTPYASLFSLVLAKYEFEKGNVDEAISQYKWIISHSNEDEMKHVARLRLIRILLDQKNYDEAETWLMTERPHGFEPRYQELMGDLYVARGDIEQARVAYDKAIAQDGNATSQWLRLKRQDLGAPEENQKVELDPSV